MPTFVALQNNADLVTELLHPAVPQPAAPQAELAGSQLGILLFHTARRTRSFVFRAEPTESPRSVIPCVRPAVDLLLSTSSRLAASRLRNLLLFLRRRRIEPDRLSDDFWIDLGVLLSSRLQSSTRYLSDLLAHERLPS